MNRIINIVLLLIIHLTANTVLSQSNKNSESLASHDSVNSTKIEQLRFLINSLKGDFQQLTVDSLEIQKKWHKYVKKNKDSQRLWELISESKALSHQLKKYPKVNSEYAAVLASKTNNIQVQKSLELVQERIDSISHKNERDSIRLRELELAYNNLSQSSEFSDLTKDQSTLFQTTNKVVRNTRENTVIDDNYIVQYFRSPYNQEFNSLILSSDYKGLKRSKVKKYCSVSQEASKLISVLNKQTKVSIAKITYEYGIKENVDKWQDDGYVYIVQQFKQKYADLLNGIQNNNYTIISPGGCPQ